MSILSAAAVGLALYALSQKHDALSRELAVKASEAISHDSDVGLLLAVEGVKAKATNEAVESLRHALNEAPLKVLRGHADVVTHAAFSPDGRSVVTASFDRTAQVWDCGLCTDVQGLLSLATSRISRPLTIDERHQYLHASDCWLTIGRIGIPPGCVATVSTESGNEKGPNAEAGK